MGNNTAIAFALVFIAGMSTALGSAIVFVPGLAKYATGRLLARTLAFAAGVMIYVSFVEIFQKSVQAFLDAEFTASEAYTGATLCFFSGLLLMTCLNKFVAALVGQRGHSHGVQTATDGNNTNEGCQDEADEVPEEEHIDNAFQNAVCLCDHDHNIFDDLKQLEGVGNQHDETATKENTRHSLPDIPDMLERGTSMTSQQTEALKRKRDRQERYEEREARRQKKEAKRKAKIEAEEAKERAKIMKMSLATALAVALHNAPEGLSTFVAALDETRVGVFLAFAIACHNIPEGICISVPLYFATGNKWKAFAYGCFSGLAEPFAAAIVWAVVGGSFSDIMFGVLFGLISGMMVLICVHELLPTAHRYDTDHSVVTNSFMSGMAITALSLVLQYW